MARELETSKDIGIYSPAPYILAEKYGPGIAMLYGNIYRSQKMKLGVCKKSFDTLAKELGIKSRDTIRVWIKKLIADGYIEDLAPEVTNHTRTLVVTDKLKLSLDDMPADFYAAKDQEPAENRTPPADFPRLPAENYAIARGNSATNQRSDKENQRKSEGNAPPPPEEFTPFETAAAIATFHDNGNSDNLKLYTLITGQTFIVPRYQIDAFQYLTAIREDYKGTYESLVEYGKKHFAAWCNTTSISSGRKYSPTNPGWLSKLYDSILKIPTIPEEITRVEEPVELRRPPHVMS